MLDAHAAQPESDQTLSDADRARSERDQISSDRDQAASDRDLAAGRVDAHTHAASRDIRQRAGRQRDQTAHVRQDTVRKRAEISDVRERSDGDGEHHGLTGVTEVLAFADRYLAQDSVSSTITAGSAESVSVGHPRAVFERRPARAQHIAALRHTATALAADAGATPHQLEDIALAVSEALTNAVEYAYPDHDSPGDMAVHATAVDYLLEIIVSDEGIGMPTPGHTQDLGMGHALIALVTDAFKVDSEHTWGVRVRMTFELG